MQRHYKQLWKRIESWEDTQDRIESWEDTHIYIFENDEIKEKDKDIVAVINNHSSSQKRWIHIFLLILKSFSHISEILLLQSNYFSLYGTTKNRIFLYFF